MQYAIGELAALFGASRREIVGALSLPAKLARKFGKDKFHKVDFPKSEIWLTDDVAAMIRNLEE